MNALTAVKTNADSVTRSDAGFTFAPSVQSPRLLELTFSAKTTAQFLQQVEQWPVQALEYKSFYVLRSVRSSTPYVATSYSRCLLKRCWTAPKAHC